MKIYKFQIDFNREGSSVQMPLGARILSVGLIGGKVFVWARVDPRELTFKVRRFFILGTGWEFASSDGLLFLGTVFQGDESIGQEVFVWHVFVQAE